MPNRRIKITEGEVFGKLTTIQEDGKRASGHILWLCTCECGAFKKVPVSSLKNGSATSCGCSQRKGGHNKSHGLSGHRLYKIWSGIKKRCYSETCDKYEHYGGRGITMCEDWKINFLSFYVWALKNGWVDGLTIERIEVNDGYGPNNCKWATMLEQGTNKRNTIKLILNGVSIPLSQASRKFNIKQGTIRERLRKGWTHEECVSNKNFCSNKIVSSLP